MLCILFFFRLFLSRFLFRRAKGKKWSKKIKRKTEVKELPLEISRSLAIESISYICKNLYRNTRQPQLLLTGVALRLVYNLAEYWFALRLSLSLSFPNPIERSFFSFCARSSPQRSIPFCYETSSLSLLSFFSIWFFFSVAYIRCLPTFIELL